MSTLKVRSTKNCKVQSTDLESCCAPFCSVSPHVLLSLLPLGALVAAVEDERHYEDDGGAGDERVEAGATDEGNGLHLEEQELLVVLE